MLHAAQRSPTARVLRDRAGQARERDRGRLGLHRLRGRRLAGHARRCSVTLVVRRGRPARAAGSARRPGARIHGWLEELGVELLLGARRRGDRRPAPCTSPGATPVDRRPGPDGRGRRARAPGWRRPPGSTSRTGRDRGRRAHAHRAPRASTPAGDVALARNAAAGRQLRVEHWGEALNMGEVAGAHDRGRASAVGRRARLLVDDRRAHAQVRRVGRRLRRGAPGRPRRRRVHRLVRHARASPSACSPTSATRTTSAGRELIEPEAPLP